MAVPLSRLTGMVFTGRCGTTTEGMPVRSRVAGWLGFWCGFLAAPLAWGQYAVALPRARLQPPQAMAPPAPMVVLGQPVPFGVETGQKTAGNMTDGTVHPASFNSTPVLDPWLVRTQGPEPGGPTLTPPLGAAPPPPPPPPSEMFNSGVANEPPPGGSFWGRCGDFFDRLCRGGSGEGRKAFQSDHCFDNFISPITDPSLFEDPRSLTEFRPVFLYQGVSSNNPYFYGGSVSDLNLQGRLSLTDSWSIVLNRLGWVWIKPHNAGDIFQTHSGFSEIWLGPKFTVRSEKTGTLFAGGLTFQIPVGSTQLGQGTGSLSLEPYFSFAQNFWRTSYGSMNFMNTTGYSFRTDNVRSEYVFSAFHLDFNIAEANKYYPVLEMTYFQYTRNGNGLPLPFDGRDLANFGASQISPKSQLTIAPGFRYKFSECVQTGIGVQFPVAGFKNLMDYRITADLIFRY